MKKTSIAVVLVLIASLCLLAEQKPAAPAAKHTGAKAAKKMEVKVVTPDKVDWQAAKRLPEGAQVAVLEGDPMKGGAYVMRIKMPDGFKIPPHWHPAPERVTLLQGDVGVGMGSTWDESKMNTIPAGTFALIPAHQPHYAMSKGETIIQIHGTGPWQIHYVNPSDDPEHKK